MYWDTASKLCKFGSECRHLRRGQCYYYHPDEELIMFSGIDNRLRSGKYSHWNYRGSGITPSRQRSDRVSRRSFEQANIFSYSDLIVRTSQSFRSVLSISPLGQSSRSTLQNIFESEKKVKPITQEEFRKCFQKNKRYIVHDLKQEELEKFGQCTICGDNFRDNHQKKKEEPESKISEFQQSQHSQELVELFCKHVFHTNCAEKWLVKQSTCPLCRKDFRKHKQYEQSNSNSH